MVYIIQLMIKTISKSLQNARQSHFSMYKINSHDKQNKKQI